MTGEVAHTEVANDLPDPVVDVARAADHAMLEAKRTGRDRLVRAEDLSA